MRRLIVSSAMALALMAMGHAALAQGTVPGEAAQYCVTIIGDAPASGWTPSTLKQALISGDAALGTISDAGDCTPTPSPSPTLAAGDTGAWISSGVTKDPITDKATVAIVVAATTATNSFGEKPELYIRCKDDQTALFISWNDYLGSSDETTATDVRVDGGAVSTAAWANSTDSTAAFYVGNVEAYVQSLFGHDEFVARVTPYNSAAVTATFPITRIENAIKEVRTACNW